MGQSLLAPLKMQQPAVEPLPLQIFQGVIHGFKELVSQKSVLPELGCARGQ